jgi:hypothetical protein
MVPRETRRCSCDSPVGLGEKRGWGEAAELHATPVAFSDTFHLLAELEEPQCLTLARRIGRASNPADQSERALHGSC